MVTNAYCTCNGWGFYHTHYNETFYWNSKAKTWYIGWLSLADQNGITQVSRYAIPVKYCPLCGGKLLNPEDD